MEDVSPACQKAVIELKYLPTVERIIEALHSRIKGALPGKKKKRSAVTVSLAAGRLAEFEGRIERRPHTFVEVARHMEGVRNSWQQLEVFGFVNHPTVLPSWSGQVRRVHHTKFDKVVVDCLYFLDPSDQYRDVRVVVKAQNALTYGAAKQKRALQNSAEGVRDNCRGEALRMAMEEHFLALVRKEGAGFRFSLECPDDASSPAAVSISHLSSVLQCPVGKARPEITLRHARAAMEARQNLRDDGEALDFHEDDRFQAQPALGGSSTVHMTVVHAEPGNMRLPAIGVWGWAATSSRRPCHHGARDHQCSGWFEAHCLFSPNAIRSKQRVRSGCLAGFATASIDP